MKPRPKTLALLATAALLSGMAGSANAEIGIISAEDAKKLIENADAAKRPIVLDTRGGYKDYFRGHLPTAQHINFDTLRGTDHAVPVQYLPADITKASSSAPVPQRAAPTSSMPQAKPCLMMKS